MKTIQSGIFTAILLLSLTAKVKAQYVLKEADTQFELFNYNKAIELYQKAYHKKQTLHAAQRLAETYQLVDNYPQAESWYAIASAMPQSNPENTLYYAKALQNNAKYDEAKTAYQKYISLKPDVSPAQQQIWLASCDSAKYWIKNPVPVTLLNEKGLNSTGSDWGAITYNKGIVFTSDRNQSGDTKKSKPFFKFDGPTKLPDPNNYGWTGNEYLRLYEKSEATDSLKFFALNAQTNYHIGAASFTADGNTLYFTMTRIPEKITRKKGQTATINLEIYSSTKDANGTWGKPVPFRYNRVNEYSVGDPSIAADGNTLYFVSNMPGGKGGTDIYRTTKNSDGTWADAVNLAAVNTSGNERNPFPAADGNFYFSSDGLIGMGGLDIYKARQNAAGLANPVNLGYPVNSPQDDFAYNMDLKGKGFIASNRPGGTGNDDIYSFTAQMILYFKLEGTVYDRKTNLPLSGAIVTLNKQNGGTLTAVTNNQGTFNFNLDQAADYTLKGEKANYSSDAAALTTKNLNQSETLHKDLFLETIVLNKPIRIENIYYDFDKADIRPDAARELDKLVSTLKTNETIWIELSSYTDSRGRDEYNQWLSQKRANSAVSYIISRGIDKARITGRGYGETHLINRCANGVKCSDAMHQLNRRTEFKVVRQ
ncbi:OmpA family protein [Pedobacter lusitanus]